MLIFSHQNQGDPHLARVELKLREASVWIRQSIPEQSAPIDARSGVEKSVQFKNKSDII